MQLVLLGNLLRNAFSYTDECEVVVEIAPLTVVIRDSCVGTRVEPLND